MDNIPVNLDELEGEGKGTKYMLNLIFDQSHSPYNSLEVKVTQAMIRMLRQILS